MTSDVIIYWRRSIEVSLLLVALVFMGIYGHDIPQTVWVALVGLVGASLGIGQSPMATTSTTIKTVRPPPMPPPPVIDIPIIETGASIPPKGKP